jgi:hypothetical protein
LILDSNKIEDDGFLSWLKGAQTNQVLKSLVLTRNQIGAIGLMKLLEAFESHTLTLKFDLQENPIPICHESINLQEMLSKSPFKDLTKFKFPEKNLN